MRIRKRPFQRAILLAKSLCECTLIGVQHIDSARVEFGNRIFAFENMKRGTLFGSCFGKDKRSGRELKRSEPDSSAWPPGWSFFFPTEPPRYHEMNNQKQIAFEFDNDSLPEPANAYGLFAN